MCANIFGILMGSGILILFGLLIWSFYKLIKAG